MIMYLFIGPLHGQNFDHSLPLNEYLCFSCRFSYYRIRAYVFMWTVPKSCMFAKMAGSQTTPKTGHPWDVMGSHHGPLAAAPWYQCHGKVVPKPSAPTYSIGRCCRPLSLVWATLNWWGRKVSTAGSPCFSCYFSAAPSWCTAVMPLAPLLSFADVSPA